MEGSPRQRQRPSTSEHEFSKPRLHIPENMSVNGDDSTVLDFEQGTTPSSLDFELEALRCPGKAKQPQLQGFVGSILHHEYDYNGNALLDRILPQHST